jgi:thiamine pyrophosphokinase
LHTTLPGDREGFLILRTVIFANGKMSDPAQARAQVKKGDLLIAADGGALHCLELNLVPDLVIGDFDSLQQEDLEILESRGAEIIRYPARKDYTDLELALQHAVQRGAENILVIAALGARWDQTLANLLLPAASLLQDTRVSLIDGPQEIHLVRGPERLELAGKQGDTVSLIPLGSSADKVTTQGLEYPLNGETLDFGSTRGISNVMLGESASIELQQGLLLCVIIHGDKEVLAENR